MTSVQYLTCFATVILSALPPPQQDVYPTIHQPAIFFSAIRPMCLPLSRPAVAVPLRPAPLAPSPMGSGTGTCRGSAVGNRGVGRMGCSRAPGCLMPAAIVAPIIEVVLPVPLPARI